MIKLVVTDVDDTLLGSNHKVSEKNREIIEKCRNNDIKVILASGRPDFGMMKIVNDLKLDSYENYLLSFNGAKISNLKTGELIYEKFLSADRIKFLIDKALENNCDILTYQNNRVITNSNNEYARIESELVGAELIISENIKEEIKEGAAKVIILKNPEEATIIKDKLSFELGEEYEVAMSKPFFIEINDKGISKGVSLDALCKKLGLTNENVMALGDGLNDLSMIEFSGLGVAVGNANDKLKEAANFISKTNDEDGFAYAVEKFIFDKKK
ncbi:Cof-type HAD-IIB family hydrolase [Gemella cuniculi]|uniref:Cof-type HAD-IIB family hydrolase n=1 Tax=Gemella cuniculi TaxID=150240 RepID=UPI00040637B1|nr:Cof-type HAD-IIB family hydrolase [Gemella cuniculi]